MHPSSAMQALTAQARQWGKVLTLSPCDSALIAAAGHIASPCALLLGLLAVNSFANPKKHRTAVFGFWTQLVSGLRGFAIVAGILADCTTTLLPLLSEYHGDTHAAANAAIAGLGALSGLCCLAIWMRAPPVSELAVGVGIALWCVMEILSSAPAVEDTLTLPHCSITYPGCEVPLAALAFRGLLLAFVCIPTARWSSPPASIPHSRPAGFEDGGSRLSIPATPQTAPGYFDTQKQTAAQNFHEEAGVLSQALFLWMGRLLATCRIRRLLHHDIPAPPSDAEIALSSAADFWHTTAPPCSPLPSPRNRASMQPSSPSLLRHLSLQLAPSLALLLAVRLLRVAIVFAGGLFLQRLVHHITFAHPAASPANATLADSEQEEAEGFWSGAALPFIAVATCTLLDGLLRAQEGYYLVVEQYKAKAALIAAIFRATLTRAPPLPCPLAESPPVAPPSPLPEPTTPGVSTLDAADYTAPPPRPRAPAPCLAQPCGPTGADMVRECVQPVAEALGALLLLASFPFTLFAALAILSVLLNAVAAVAAAVALSVLALCTCLAHLRASSLHRILRGHRQQSLCAIDEMLAGLIPLKHFGWEGVFARRVTTMRRREQQQLERLLPSTTVAALLLDLFLPCALVACMVAFDLWSQGGGTKRDPGVVMASFCILAVVSRELKQMLKAVPRLLRAAQALQCVQHFLLKGHQVEAPWEGGEGDRAPAAMPSGGGAVGGRLGPTASSRGAQYAVRVEGASFGSLRDHSRAKRAADGGEGVGEGGGGWGQGQHRAAWVELREVSAGLREGSKTAVVGGAGKSTLLLGLMGERVAVEGRVMLRGEETGMGYAAPYPWVGQELTLVENVMLGGCGARDKRFVSALEASGLGGGAKRDAGWDVREGRGWAGPGWEDDESENEGGGLELAVGAVSREVRDRIGFARAVYCGQGLGRLCLLDEPLASLPLQDRLRMVEAALKGPLRNATVVLATDNHDMAALCGDALLLGAAGVTAFGRTADVLGSFEELGGGGLFVEREGAEERQRDPEGSRSDREGAREEDAKRGKEGSEEEEFVKQIELASPGWDATAMDMSAWEAFRTWCRLRGVLSMGLCIVVAGLSQVGWKAGEIALGVWCEGISPNVTDTNGGGSARQTANTSNLVTSSSLNDAWDVAAGLSMGMWGGCLDGEFAKMIEFFGVGDHVNALWVLVVAIAIRSMGGVVVMWTVRGGGNGAAQCLWRQAAARLRDVWPPLLSNATITRGVRARLARFSITDDALPRVERDLLLLVMSLLGCLGLMIAILPSLALPVVLTFFAYLRLQLAWSRMDASLVQLREAKDEGAVQLLQHTAASAVEVRAAGVGMAWESTFMARYAGEGGVEYARGVARVWLHLRVDLLCAALKTAVCGMAIVQLHVGDRTAGGMVGLLLVNALLVTWLLRDIADALPSARRHLAALARLMQLVQLPVEDVTGPRKGNVLGLLPPEAGNEADGWRNFFWSEGKGKARFKPPAQLSWARGGGGLALEGVSVHRRRDGEGDEVEVNVAVGDGTWVGVKGGPGTGKTELVRELAGLGGVARGGKVVIGGEDTAGLPLSYWRKLVAVVPQEPWLFTGTLRDNLDLLGEAGGDWELWAILETLQVADRVRGWPGKLDYVVQARGAGMGRSDQQALCLARALLAATVRGAKVVCLDGIVGGEGGLDPQTEELLRTRQVAGGFVVVITEGAKPLDELVDIKVRLGDAEEETTQGEESGNELYGGEWAAAGGAAEEPAAAAKKKGKSKNVLKGLWKGMMGSSKSKDVDANGAAKSDRDRILEQALLAAAAAKT